MSLTKADNLEMVEIYGRLSEALDMTVVHRTNPSRISVHDSHHISIKIEAQGKSLSAAGSTGFEEIEMEGSAKNISENLQERILTGPEGENLNE